MCVRGSQAVSIACPFTGLCSGCASRGSQSVGGLWQHEHTAAGAQVEGCCLVQMRRSVVFGRDAADATFPVA
jgi:hypothetical protein